MTEASKRRGDLLSVASKAILGYVNTSQRLYQRYLEQKAKEAPVFVAASPTNNNNDDPADNDETNDVLMAPRESLAEKIDPHMSPYFLIRAEEIELANPTKTEARLRCARVVAERSTMAVLMHMYPTIPWDGLKNTQLLEMKDYVPQPGKNVSCACGDHALPEVQTVLELGTKEHPWSLYLCGDHLELLMAWYGYMCPTKFLDDDDKSDKAIQELRSSLFEVVFKTLSLELTSRYTMPISVHQDLEFMLDPNDKLVTEEYASTWVTMIPTFKAHITTARKRMSAAEANKRRRAKTAGTENASDEAATTTSKSSGKKKAKTTK